MRRRLLYTAGLGTDSPVPLRLAWQAAPSLTIFAKATIVETATVGKPPIKTGKVLL
ncbi:MAG: hypothetical protein ACKVOQ_12585 [Cyclobacteriaceae bacterium]